MRYCIAIGTRVRGKKAPAAATVPRRLIPSNYIEETSESAGVAAAAPALSLVVSD